VRRRFIAATEIQYAAGRQPAGRPPAPGRLALVQAFVNSHFDLEHEHGADLLATGSGVGAWLLEQGLVHRLQPVEEDRRARAIAVREGLRGLLAAHNGAQVDSSALDSLQSAAHGLLAGIVVGDDGRAWPVARSADLEGALGLVLALVSEAQATGSWERLKACPGELCGWAFYDHSRNHASTWCSMAICGSREKARTYRRRSLGGDAGRRLP
jgi:predicted RNA-binding Zn ribbon-like protein